MDSVGFGNCGIVLLVVDDWDSYVFYIVDKIVWFGLYGYIVLFCL